MSIKVDAKGLDCPMPVIKTKKALGTIESGVVEVLLDNQIAKNNVLKLAKSMNMESEVVLDKEDDIIINITKGEGSGSGSGETPQSSAGETVSPSSNEVVFIKSDRMGSGNDDLGKVLIKGFVYSLTECEPYPKSVVLVNGGVTLSTENDATVENLKVLEDAGVEILSCGTCLDYYNLKDKVRVGTVTNMYTIVETLKSASKIITI